MQPTHTPLSGDKVGEGIGLTARKVGGGARHSLVIGE